MTHDSLRPVARRRFLKAASAGVTATALAGCRERQTGSGLGDTLKLGVLAPGADGTFAPGTSIADGARLAAKQLNEDGGVLDVDVEVVVKDTQQSTSTGRTVYRELVGSENVNATFGVFTSEVLMSLMDLIASEEMIHITTGAATPDSSRLLKDEYEKYKYYFRAGPLNSVQLGENLVDFAELNFSNLGWESIALLSESYEWNQPIVELLRNQLPEQGVDIVSDTRYATGTSNFGPIYDDIEAAGADAVYALMAHPGGAVPAVAQWSRGRRQFEFGGVHVPSQLPSFYQSSQGSVGYVVTQNVATPQSELTSNTQPFIQAYQSEFDRLPVFTGYLTYDAVLVYAQVISEIETVAEGDVIPAMEETAYEGTIGTIEFNGPDSRFPHDLPYSIDRNYPIHQQWQPSEDGNSGTQEVIFPDRFSTADYQQPPWIR